MIIGRFFPALCSMTRVTCLIFKLSLVRVLVAVRGVACFGIKRFITTLDMALFTLRINMLPVQFVTLICLRCMVKKRRLPALGIVARVTGLLLELSLVLVFMAIGSVACLGIKRLVTTLDVALFALCINVLPVQLVTLVFLGCMIKERRLPA